MLFARKKPHPEGLERFYHQGLPELGWCWTRQSLFPYLYQHSTGSWLCFSSADSNRFYRYADNAWTLVE